MRLPFHDWVELPVIWLYQSHDCYHEPHSLPFLRSVSDPQAFYGRSISVCVLGGLIVLYARWGQRSFANIGGG